MISQKIKTILNQYDKTLHLECDGFTRVVTYILHQNQIKHQVYIGSVKWKEHVFDPHWWVVCGDELIDFRLRMWFGVNAPHGIFKIKKHNGVFENKQLEITYDGTPENIFVNDTIFKILTM